MQNQNVTVGNVEMRLKRNVSDEDMDIMKLKFMPGFRLKWLFTQDGILEKSKAVFKDSFLTKEFVR